MLAEAVIALYEKKAEARNEGPRSDHLTITTVSPCPYESFINLHHLDYSPVDSSNMMLMEDGHPQEESIIKQIIAAGFQVVQYGKYQKMIHVGKAKVRGKGDGLVRMDDEGKVWDLVEIKAMSSMRFTNFIQKGFKAEPRIKCQVQLLMHSEEYYPDIQRCWIYAKHKDACRPFNLLEERDSDYAKPIIEVTDAIILENYEPKKELTELCTTCYHNKFCWKSPILDLSDINVASLPEYEEKWIKGKAFQEAGSELEEEAKAFLIPYLGDQKVLFTDRLKVQRIPKTLNKFSKSKFIEHFGAENLDKVVDKEPSEQIRIDDITEY